MVHKILQILKRTLLDQLHLFPIPLASSQNSSSRISFSSLLLKELALFMQTWLLKKMVYKTILDISECRAYMTIWEVDNTLTSD